MDNQKIAEKITRELTADYGDTQVYLNVFDFFEAEGRKLDSDEVQVLQGMLIGVSARVNINNMVRKELLRNRDDKKWLESKNIRVKR